MQLVAYGAQDIYLTGNPQITFFKVVYRRHTNFSCETIEQPIDSAQPGGRYVVPVHRNGDLATNAALKIKLKKLTFDGAGQSDGEVAWVRKLGHALLKQVEVEIGGSKIDKHVGTWLNIWHELTSSEAQQRGYARLIGDVPGLTALRSRAVGLPAYTLYIPLQFWFCRNTGLALPLIALQYHEVRFHIELESMNKLLVWSGAAPTVSVNFEQASVMVDYVYLDSEERRRFAQVGHEYLIEQVQSSVESLGTSTSTNLSAKFKLSFNHPCKEIVWGLKVGAFSGEGLSSFSGGSQFLGYTHDDAAWQTEGLNSAAKTLVEGLVFTSLAGQNNLEFYDSDNLDSTGLNSFDENDSSAGNKITISWIETGSGTSGPEMYLKKLLKVGGIDIVSKINSAHLNITYDLATGVISGVECDEIDHDLDLEHVSIPVTAGTLGPFAKPYNVVQHHNFGLRLDGAGNPCKTASIELNGQARFAEQEGSYFNYWTTRAHTRTPADGINVYCFGLHPEQHQPSGSANLSRIDNTLLCVTFTDSYRSESGYPTLDWTKNTKLYIFAVNYNVLRIMSGMGGLAYSN
jgi:hypothetical protein